MQPRELGEWLFRLRTDDPDVALTMLMYAGAITDIGVIVDYSSTTRGLHQSSTSPS